MNPYEEFVDFVIARVPADDMLALRASDEAHNYMYSLLDKEKMGVASPDERRILDQCLCVEHIVGLMKAKARTKSL